MGLPIICPPDKEPRCAEQNRYVFCLLTGYLFNELAYRKVFLTVSKSFLALWAEVFKLGVAI